MHTQNLRNFTELALPPPPPKLKRNNRMHALSPTPAQRQLPKRFKIAVTGLLNLAGIGLLLTNSPLLYRILFVVGIGCIVLATSRVAVTGFHNPSLTATVTIWGFILAIYVGVATYNSSESLLKESHDSLQAIKQSVEPLSRVLNNHSQQSQERSQEILDTIRTINENE
jgi:hypothetical protein